MTQAAAAEAALPKAPSAEQSTTASTSPSSTAQAAADPNAPVPSAQTASGANQTAASATQPAVAAATTQAQVPNSPASAPQADGQAVAPQPENAPAVQAAAPTASATSEANRAIGQAVASSAGVASAAVSVSVAKPRTEATATATATADTAKKSSTQSREDKARGLTAPEARAEDRLTARDLVAKIDELVRDPSRGEQFAPAGSASTGSSAIGDVPSASAAPAHAHEAQATVSPMVSAPAQTASTVIHAAQSVRPAPVVHAPQILGQISVQIQRAAEEGGGRVSIQLRPEELGRVGVDLDIQHDGHVLAVITADRPETLEALRRDSAALERALQDAGLKTDQQSLSFNLRGDGGNGGREQRGPSVPAAIARAIEPETATSARDATLQGGGALSGLNIRV